MKCPRLHSLLAAVFFSATAARTGLAVTLSINPSADAFMTGGSADVNAGSPSLNYGGAGALMVSAPGSQKGEIQSLLKFNLAPVKTTLDGMFGTGNWLVDTITLQLGTNFGTQGAQPNNPIFNQINGGLFSIEWLANDNWGEGSGTPGSPFTPLNPPVDGVTFATLAGLASGTDRALGTFLYTPVGNTNPPTIPPATYSLGLDASFLADLSAGNDVSLRAFAADAGVNYLFNSRSFGTASSRPTLVVSASAAPEPATSALLAGAALPGLCGRRRHARTV